MRCCVRHCRALASSPSRLHLVEEARLIPGVVLGRPLRALRQLCSPPRKHAARTDVSAFLDEAGATLGASRCGGRMGGRPLGDGCCGALGDGAVRAWVDSALTVCGWALAGDDRWRCRLRAGSRAVGVGSSGRSAGVCRGRAGPALIGALQLVIGQAEQRALRGTQGRCGHAWLATGTVLVDDVVTTGATSARWSERWDARTGSRTDRSLPHDAGHPEHCYDGWAFDQGGTDACHVEVRR